MRICVWRRVAVRLICLGVQKGVGRRASPYHRKDNGANTLATIIVISDSQLLNCFTHKKEHKMTFSVMA
jgi:hypothetical protein